MTTTLARWFCVLAAAFLVAMGCKGGDTGGGRTRPGQGGTGGVSDAAGSGGSGGSSGNAGSAAGASGAGGSLPQAGDDATTGGDLDLHVQDQAALAIDVFTVSCSGDCADVTAVAKGGNPPYAFAWDDGSTEVTRTLCPDADTTYSVTVHDTAVVDSEFSMPQQEATASVSARVLDCTTPEPTPDAGAGSECETDTDCGPGQTCFEQTCVGDGGLRFSLTWNVDTDFDLYVRLPDGRTVINFVNTSAMGGMLDVDDCFESCRRPGGPHVENIFFVMDAPRGRYEYWVANPGVTEPDDFELEVSVAGVVQATQMGSLAAFRLESPRYTFEL